MLRRHPEGRPPRLRVDEVERAEGCPGTRVFRVGSHHHHVAVVVHRAGEHVQTGGRDPVVVRHEDAQRSV